MTQQVSFTPAKTVETCSQLSRILVVDDDPNMLDLFSSTLSPGYICEGASSAPHARKLIDEDGPYDLIVCDVQLEAGSKVPEETDLRKIERNTDGIELLKYIRSHHPGTSTILMSGQHSQAAVVTALRERADDYLIKPFTLIELYESVERIREIRLHPTRNEEEVKEHGWNTAARALSAALCTRDNETSGHAVRVVYFSLRLGQEMGLSKNEMLALKLGSSLHDIGKIGVPDAILRKPGKLTDEEKERMKVHPLVGQHLVRKLDLPEGAARVVGQHHEKWDGSGYPHGLIGEEIDLAARIFSVVDAFDAIISDRVYRKGRPYADAALEIRRYSGTQFDPRVVEAFLSVPQEDWEHLRRGCLMDDQNPATL